jgi:hypothetical protein
MKFLATIYGDESGWATATEEELAQVMRAYEAFGRDAAEAGVLLGGDALHPTPAGKTIRIRDGEQIVTDGPFAETKEQLGGYYLLECRDLDEAVAWGARIPGAHQGSVEVRPIMEFETSGDAIASSSATTAS